MSILGISFFFLLYTEKLPKISPQGIPQHFLNGTVGSLAPGVLAAPSRETQHRPVRRTVAGPTEALGIDEGFHKIDGMTIGPFPLSGKHRSQEHTSELQSRGHLVCRLLLEKKKENQCKIA